MTKLKKSIRTFFRFTLLLYFSAITLSLDFLHDHSKDFVVCKDAATTGSCHHKSHLSQNTSCWVCAAHLQKEAALPYSSEALHPLPPIVRIHCLPTVARVAGILCTSLLRGPPQMVIATHLTKLS